MLNIITACSVYRNYPDSSGADNSRSDLSLASIRENNISDSSFFIQKAKIELKAGNSKDDFLASIKFRNHDSILISVRSMTGIELVRIFIEKDSVFVNERLNNLNLYGTIHEFVRKYGVTKNLLCIMLGDLIYSDSQEKNLIGENGRSKFFETKVDNRKIEYEIDFIRRKVLNTRVYDIDNKLDIALKYNDFKSTGNCKFAQRIDITGYHDYNRITIDIKKIDSPFSGEMRFKKATVSDLRRIE